MVLLTDGEDDENLMLLGLLEIASEFTVSSLGVDLVCCWTVRAAGVMIDTTGSTLWAG
jgi:hypothetical protein